MSPWMITPGLAAARRCSRLPLTIFMLSLIGIPATAGFLAKYYVFNAALSANAHPTALVWLTIIGLVNSAVASYYYLRLIVVMYMREPIIAEAPAPATGAMKLALVLAAIATIYLGVMPGRVLTYSDAGARDLLPTAAAAGSADPWKFDFPRPRSNYSGEIVTSRRAKTNAAAIQKNRA